jgi:hypothetical protein
MELEKKYMETMRKLNSSRKVKDFSVQVDIDPGALCSMVYAVCGMQYAVCSMRYAVCHTYILVFANLHTHIYIVYAYTIC